MKFNKLVAVDNIGFPPSEYDRLKEYARETVIFTDYPQDESSIADRAKDADCLLVSWNTKISRQILTACTSLKYVGMCCSLYDEKSANVDIAAARELGITVLGVRDYGDQGVMNYVCCELTELLQGFGQHQWKDEPMDLSDVKTGIIGLGVTGSMVARALRCLGADIYYYDTQRKPDMEAEGMKYLDLDDLLRTADIISTHLPKHLRLLTEDKLNIYGNGKIIINPSIGPTFELKAMQNWLENKGNYLLCEKSSMTDWLGELKDRENFIYTDKVCGMTLQARDRLAQKVMGNMEAFLGNR